VRRERSHSMDRHLLDGRPPLGPRGRRCRRGATHFACCPGFGRRNSRVRRIRSAALGESELNPDANFRRNLGAIA